MLIHKPLVYEENSIWIIMRLDADLIAGLGAGKTSHR